MYIHLCLYQLKCHFILMMPWTLYFLEENIVENWHNFILKCLIKFTNETICVWFFVREVIYYWLKLKRGLLRLFFLLSISIDHVFQGLIYFTKVVTFVSREPSRVLLTVLLMSIGSVGVNSLLFPIVVICVFFFCLPWLKVY